ncbi:hypothetical protein RJD24_11140 [Bacillaceae bacterium IKA-2]|nr:hypothetical protein RJD24_11140 [Bacillaceae bacterium IKA-2]
MKATIQIFIILSIWVALERSLRGDRFFDMIITTRSGVCVVMEQKTGISHPLYYN